MTAPEFLEKFASQFEETDPSSITLETKFREIAEWSSMMALVVIAMVDEEFNVRLTGDDIRSAHTVQDIYNVVTAK
jgi:acyl carrier protein